MTYGSAEPLIRAENLKKHYESDSGFLDRLMGQREWVKAVDGVSLDIHEGETVGLVGESGCGKSTVGRTLLGLEEPTDGNVYFRGQNINELSASAMRDLRRDIQIIFQNPMSSLNPRLTVNDIIGEALDIHGLAEGQTRDERIKELLVRVGLSASHANRYPHEFSGGQLQRIGIARALAVEPDFIVCDEPVSALDVSVQAQILNLLNDLKDDYNISYLFIAHDLSVVEHISDRIAVMYLGEIVEIGTPEELFTPPQHPYTEALLSAIPEPDPLWERDRIILEGTVPSPINPPSGCKFHTRCPRVIPPKSIDLEQSEWRAILNLQTQINREDIDLGPYLSADSDTEAVVEEIRGEYNIPSPVSDDQANRVLDDALTTLVDGSFETAHRQLAESFMSPCIVHEPALQSIENGRAACHLMDSKYEDGTVDDGATIASESSGLLND